MGPAATHLGFGTCEELATGQTAKKKAPGEKGRAAFLDSAMTDFVGITISGNGREQDEGTPAGDNRRAGISHCGASAWTRTTGEKLRLLFSDRDGWYSGGRSVNAASRRLRSGGG
jgi:hypothetical protein